MKPRLHHTLNMAAITVLLIASAVLPSADGALADVQSAWFSATSYPASVGSVVPIIAGFEGDTIRLGAHRPVVLVPNQFTTQTTSSCRAQTRFISNTSSPEFAGCQVTQTPYDASTMAVFPEVSSLGQYEEYLIEMTIMILVTDAATPGMSYQVSIPDTLSHPTYRRGISAEINVLPREVRGVTETNESPLNRRSSQQPVNIDGFKASANGGESFLFSIPYDPPKGTFAYDVAIYADTGIIDLDVSKQIVSSPAVCGMGARRGIGLSEERVVSASNRPEVFEFSLPRWGAGGRTIRVCVQVVYLYEQQELGRDYFVAELTVK